MASSSSTELGSRIKFNGKTS
ncbi:hypothetical protein CCACVL1_14731 [Corchorus capsularis]|uniref:Uncharacterized protein n=1 Tax=Corchorus capsularis TaxID=210143 RepID=A0A1R3I5T6_COCAP|nr:hypothetical protein CCACVL1_14731 [Corchorus capsularis]